VVVRDYAGCVQCSLVSWHFVGRVSKRFLPDVIADDTGDSAGMGLSGNLVHLERTVILTTEPQFYSVEQCLHALWL